jgi:hypothetical protein
MYCDSQHERNQAASTRQGEAASHERWSLASTSIAVMTIATAFTVCAATAKYGNNNLQSAQYCMPEYDVPGEQKDVYCRSLIGAKGYPVADRAMGTHATGTSG